MAVCGQRFGGLRIFQLFVPSPLCSVNEHSYDTDNRGNNHSCSCPVMTAVNEESAASYQKTATSAPSHNPSDSLLESPSITVFTVSSTVVSSDCRCAAWRSAMDIIRSAVPGKTDSYRASISGGGIGPLKAAIEVVVVLELAFAEPSAAGSRSDSERDANSL